ncbi:MAG: acyl carrier protein [Sulfuricurvum sp.]|uniref:acyl carrier protein n=1 Tax=Sulfuricurvum sp. TaxID=2025608 RepID=UPI00260C5788|nr:acyl carrier protein [Sulfuricurvum sp.]MDD2829461.1 acyl carrier protein [Sulfuricurvum sp.]MDD4948456.1 acyl carrier protein [Sulfuricurvum sp.]
MSAVFEKVQEIIVEQFEKNPDEISADKRLVEDLELDSLDMFDLICALEKEYNFHFEREMGSSIETVGDIVAQLEAHKPN